MIREAKPEDIPALLEHCRAHHREKALPFPFDAVKLSMTLSGAINSPDWLVLIGPRSMLLAFCFDDLFGGGRYAFERLIRADNDLEELLARFEGWARGQGCLTASLASLERHETFARLYRRHGYRLAESVYSKVL